MFATTPVSFKPFEPLLQRGGQALALLQYIRRLELIERGEHGAGPSGLALQVSEPYP